MSERDERHDSVEVRLAPSPGRRWFGLGVTYALGALLLYLALAAPPAPAWQVFLVLAAGAALWTGEKMRRATSGAVELTAQGLRDTDGTLIARLDEIEGLDRGMFAFKPSGGFLLRLAAPRSPRVWRPGLWWRTGRRVGVGGMTSRAEARAMADLISLRLAKRDR
ncbi:hypothetical protein [Rhodosalinus sp. K401]|uniref:hypothetical protein n=1 Tax=Rhodosalinus sp. K401 TaxID=3239195 RepID=UPI0035251AC3